MRPPKPGELVLWPHTLWRPPGLVECDIVMDIGAGIRPMSFYKPKRHICVEPHSTYCAILRLHEYEVWEMDAEDALKSVAANGVGAVYLLDVIEHMEKDVGWRVIELAQQAAEKQVLVFTPIGFLAQTEDNWGHDGKYWQTHRSGWEPEEFPGWYIKKRPLHAQKGFIALWNKTS